MLHDKLTLNQQVSMSSLPGQLFPVLGVYVGIFTLPAVVASLSSFTMRDCNADRSACMALGGTARALRKKRWHAARHTHRNISYYTTVDIRFISYDTTVDIRWILVNPRSYADSVHGD